MSLTCLGSSPNERVLMMGFSGLELTSASGNQFHCTPMARASCAVMRAGLAGELYVAGCAESHGVRKAGDVVQAKAQAALEVGAEDQGKLGILLQLVDEHRGFQRLVLVEEAVFEAHRQAESANVVLAHGVAQHDVVGTFNIQELRSRPDHEHLPDFLLQRHLLQRCARPLLAFLVEVHRSGRLKFLLSESEARDCQRESKQGE